MIPASLSRLVLSARPDGFRRDGQDWKAKCPAHHDLKASLAIKVASDGKLLLHCHAGCATADVLRAWGVEWSVLFPDEPESNGSPSPSLPSPLSSPSTFSTPLDSNVLGDPEDSYDYVDEEGNFLFQVVRFPGKSFRQRRAVPGRGWVWNLAHTRRVLYRLPELIQAPEDAWIFLCEGEKDVERLLVSGLHATTNPGGAGKWNADYTALLRGRRVAILPDNDGPGRAHAKRVSEALSGFAKEVAVVELEGLPKNGDVSDWLDEGGSKEALLELAEKARLSIPPIYRGNESRETSWHLVTAAELLSEEDSEPPDLVEGLLPWGGLSIIGAKPKAGKSTIARCLSVAVAQGRDFLGRECKPGPVIYLALEEKRREVREHLRALGMQQQDPLYVHFGASPENALPELARLIAEIKPVLCVVDPLFRFTKVRDVAAYAEITNALGPLLTVARNSGCHLLLVHHNTKLEREGGDDLLGSTAIFGAVDTAIVLRRRQSGLRFAYSVQRYGKDMPNTVLQLRGPWIVAAGELEGFELEAIKGRVIEFLAQESPAAELVIRENVEGKTDHVAKALRQLVNEGKVGRSGTGKRGDPYQYSLIPLQPQTPAAHQGQQEVCPACGHAERDVVTGTGEIPTWRCLGCGQLFGQLVMEDNGNDGNEKNDQNEKNQQDKRNEENE